MEKMTLNGREFAVRKLLGKGKGGYSYLVTDGQEDYVLKQIHHEPCDYYTFGDKLASELRDYEILRATGIRMPRLLEVDRQRERLLKTYVPGPTIYDLVRDDAMEPQYRHQMEQMCAVLYPAGLNIDYFPTNFVVWQGEIYYIDFECNPYDPQWDFENWGSRYWEKTPAFLQYLLEHSK